MIQNRKNVASYLLLRNGIYYFQVRLKKNDKRRLKLRSGLIRKSLKTGSYAEAVHKARIMWFGYVMNDSNQSITDVNEERGERLDALYRRGRELQASYDKIDKNDLQEIDDFFNYEVIDQFDKESLEYYTSSSTDKNSSSEIIRVQDKTSGNSPFISEVITQFFHNKKVGMKKITDATRVKYEYELQLFIKCIGDMRISELDKRKIKENYLYKLIKLPKNISKNSLFYDANGELFGINKCIILAEKHNLPLIKPQSVLNKAKNIVTFIRWCSENDFVDKQLLDAFSELYP